MHDCAPNTLSIARAARAKTRLLSSAVLLVGICGAPQLAHAADSTTAADSTAAATDSTNAPQPIVVTGTRAQATTIKKNSQNVVDVRSQEEIRSLPDVNVAEALQRIPGVSLESDSGEGRFVNIRGMDADLNGTTYDGVRLTASNPSSPQGGARAVAFDAFPSGIIGGIEVFKSLTPDMDAEGLGGVVNLLPKTLAPNQNMLLDGSLGYGVESLHNTPRYMGDLTAGMSSGDSSRGGRFGIIVSGAYDEDRRGISDVEADYINDPTAAPDGTSPYIASKLYDDLQPRWYEYHRIREGYGGGLTFDTDTVSLFVRGVHAGYTEYAHKHILQINSLADDVIAVDNNTGDVTAEGTSPRQKWTDSKEQIGNDLVEAGGSALFGNVKADVRGAYTIGRDTVPYSLGVTIKGYSPTVTYNNVANPAIPTFSAADGSSLADPANYTNFSGSISASKSWDREYSGVMNFTVPVALGGPGGEVKFGVSARKRERQSSESNGTLDGDGLGYADFATGGDQIFYDGAYDIGPQADFSTIEALPRSSLEEDLTSYERDNEDVYAGYGEYSGQFGPLSVVGGVRVEATRAVYRANVETTSGDEDIITPNEARQNYTNWFPDLSLKYAVTPNFLIRGAFTSAIARPGFNQITAAKSVNVDDAIVSQGNPDVKPTTGHNFDLSAEYYTPGGGLTASVGLFYKAFQNYIIPTVETVTNYPGFEPGTDVELDSFENIGSAHAEGVEFELIQRFTFLPAPLDGFGVEANATLVRSKGDIRTGESHALPQTSPETYNASVFYDKGPFRIKFAAGYVSRNLWEVGGDASTDLYSQPRFRLDLGASFDVTDRVQLYFDAKNLTNTKLEFTQTPDKRYPVQREFYDADYYGGVRVKLGGRS